MIQTFIDAEKLEDIMGAGGRNRLLQYLDLSDGDDVTQSRTLNLSVDMANGIVQTYVGSVYSDPFEEIPAILTHVAANLAIYNLIKFSRMELMTQDIVDGYNDAMNTLEKVQRGELKLMFPATDRTEELTPTTIMEVGHGYNENRETEYDRNMKAY